MNKPKSSYRNLESALIVTLALASFAFAQDGKLIDASELTIKQSDVSQPALRSILDQVEIKSITYLSDGLKVKGYIAAPKKGGKLPCVIFNRGGNQSFGALDDERAARLLGNIASWGYVVVASQYRGNAGGEGKEEFGGKARSAVQWPERIYKKTPILLLHGGADWRVHPTQAFAMVSALYQSKHPFRFVFFEGGDHGLTEHREEVNRLARDWLDRYVRDKKPWPSLDPHGN